MDKSVQILTFYEKMYYTFGSERLISGDKKIMKCPFCNQEATRVIDSRPADDNCSIRRRRLCDECGKPMIEGFVIDGCSTYCSEECLHKHFSNEEFIRLYNDGNGDSYWTTWYEDSNTYN